MLRVGPFLVVTLLSGPASAEIQIGNGTGFLVNRAGWILTNAHVVEGCDSILVDRLGRSEATIVDEASDLALLRFQLADDPKPLPFRERIARLTEEIVVVGYPLTDILGSGIRATTGTVSSLSGVQSDPRYIQISAPVQPGNSGGPVLDENGNVIGVASAVLSNEAYEDSQNVNFALTAQIAIRFMSDSGVDFLLANEGQELSPEERLDVAQQGTFLLKCMSDDVGPPPHGPSSPPSTPDVMSSYEPPSAMTVYSGMDVLGFDYETIRDVTSTMCQAVCESDRYCRAFTFNLRHNICFLKSDALVLVENDGAVGGYDNTLASQVIDSGLAVTINVDSPGGDYRRIRDSDYIECTIECGVDPACRAFAYVRETRDCWLKDWVGSLQDMPGVEFGIRR